MTLALRMGKTLSELMASLSVSEFRLWLAYNAKSPIGDTRGDIQTASIVSAIYGSQGGKVKLEEALLKWGDSETEEKSAFETFLEGL
ncbi:DUF4035 domain-containing protein [Enterobacter huaxiensis]|uniref:DUF4035 domain-containing protein n=1 Tax=Enterobacter huaxiensis TaxID=2494702 RepID=UPI0021759358|nr:DUF4035 domain-containing protein [Enterobacter huaxiensis]MCS5452495.1 DUF4035 domain-containing protein [Enterobacter huaxiensis]